MRGVAGVPPEPIPAPTLAATEPSENRLWLFVALLMLLTPLGVLAVGTTWGEWSPAELQSVQARTQTSDQCPPSIPRGLQKLSTLWTAPFPGYAPTFIKSPGLGYALSAMFGVGLLLLASHLSRTLGRRRWRTRELRS